MRIVADENIVALDTYSEFGELIKLPGRRISAADVRDADALIVRSITAVNKSLLDGSRVQFVATATSGTNHLDLEWLAAAGITVADAAGCNANAVVEYVFTSICELIRSGRYSLHNKTVAVIGAGQVGGRLLSLFQRLGLRCIACDPYVESAALRVDRSDAQGSYSSSGLSSGSWMKQSGFKFGTLEEALTADIISIHTPLTYTGEHPTFHLINAERLAALKPGTLMINAARGEIVDNAALLLYLQSNPGRLLTVFDVWEAEPTVSPDLAALIDIATPHIAGYSIEAKVSASVSNFCSFRKHFQLEDATHSKDTGDLKAAGYLKDTAQLANRAPPTESNKESRALLFPEGVSLKDIVSDDSARQWQAAEAVCHAFQVMNLSDEFKTGVGTKDGDALFDELRKKLTLRHEYGLRYLV